MWGGMHHTPMRYLRSATSDVDSEWSELNMGDVATLDYTYPESAVSPVNGDVFHISRADTQRAELFHYRRTTETWHNVGTVFSGRPGDGQEGGAPYTVYLPELVVDSAGDVHIVTIWRQLGPDIQRHQGTYVRYRPSSGRFYKANGADVTSALPITTLDVDPVWQWQPRVLEWSEIEIASDPRITVDAANRPVVGYNYAAANGTPEDGAFQHRVAAWTGSRWQRATLDGEAGLYGVVNVQAGGGVVRGLRQQPGRGDRFDSRSRLPVSRRRDELGPGGRSSPMPSCTARTSAVR